MTVLRKEFANIVIPAQAGIQLLRLCYSLNYQIPSDLKKVVF